MSNIRARGWTFTINNPQPGELESCEFNFYETEARYTVYQLEQGGNCATPHIQGYIYWDIQKRFSFLKGLYPRAHLERAGGDAEDNRIYCTKSEGRLEGPWELGELPSPGARSDLYEIQEKLDGGTTLEAIAMEHFPSYIRHYRGFMQYQLLTQAKRNWEMEILVIWGESGVGKSRYCYERYPGAFWKSKNSGLQQFWDGYQGEAEIVMDEFYGWLSWDYLLRLTDRYPFSLDVKHGTVHLLAKKIIFTSNKHPKDWYNFERLGSPPWETRSKSGRWKNPLRRRLSKIIELAPPLDDSSDEEIKRERVPIPVREQGNLFELYSRIQ